MTTIGNGKTANDVPIWNGSAWVPGAVPGGGGSASPEVETFSLSLSERVALGASSQFWAAKFRTVNGWTPTTIEANVDGGVAVGTGSYQFGISAGNGTVLMVTATQAIAQFARVEPILAPVALASNTSYWLMLWTNANSANWLKFSKTGTSYRTAMGPVAGLIPNVGSSWSPAGASDTTTVPYMRVY